ncbi:MAG: cyclic nucleotide-binding domain-containing protein [Desulfobacula sp.]|nr:cyclic nucleotide-binding domain-containing protein [Desulfobacula sp.]
MNKKIDLFQFPFFSDISRERLSEIEGFSIVQSYDKGSIVFQSNEPARNLYGIIEGDVELNIIFKETIVTKDIKYEEYIRKHEETFERPIIIEEVKNKEIFGWSALVEPEKMTATATCTSDCEIILIPASKLKLLFSRDTETGYLLSSRLSVLIARRLNNRTKKLVDTWCNLFETLSISSLI